MMKKRSWPLALPLLGNYDLRGYKRDLILGSGDGPDLLLNKGQVPIKCKWYWLILWCIMGENIHDKFAYFEFLSSIGSEMGFWRCFLSIYELKSRN